MAGNRNFDIEQPGLANTPPAHPRSTQSGGTYNLDPIGPQNGYSTASYNPKGPGEKDGPTEIEQPGGTNSPCGTTPADD